MPSFLHNLLTRWQRWLGWHWVVTDALLGFVGGWLAVLFLMAISAAIGLLARSIGGGEGSLGTGALIVALLSAPFLIWNTVIRHRALEFQIEGHLTDRLAKTVEQLGAEKTVKKDGVETTEPNLEVRIGGLLSLERIAQDSTRYDNGRDHVRVMEIICAYIRNNAPAIRSNAILLTAQDLSGRFLRESGIGLALRAGPRADVSVAMSVLGRRTIDQRKVEANHQNDTATVRPWAFDERPKASLDDSSAWLPTKQSLTLVNDEVNVLSRRVHGYGGYRLDLSGSCFNNARWKDMQFGGTIFDDCQMHFIDMDNCNLTGASFKRAELEDSRITASRFHAAVCEDAILSRTVLSRSGCAGTSFARANLAGSNISNTYFHSSDLNHAKMANTKISRSSFIGASLNHADMNETLLFMASFRLAAMHGVNLVAAHTHGADFTGANLASGDLGCCKSITFNQLESAFGDRATSLPEELGTKAPKHWPKWKLGDYSADQWLEWLEAGAGYEPPEPPPD